MTTAGRRPARRFHDGFDEKTRDGGSFRFRCDLFGVYEFLGSENNSFLRRACHFNVELLVAQDLGVSLRV